MLRWLDRIRACAPPGIGLSQALLDEVAAAYASPGRHYHTLEHVAEVASHFAAVSTGPGWRDPTSVFAAILAHDAVYDVARRDNEARSADVGRRWCAGHLGIDGERCAALVLATAHHGAPIPGDDPDLALFLDCDLAILGAEPARYDRYEADVAREYAAAVSEAEWRTGRARFLEAIVGRGRVYHTDWFESRLGDAARANVRRATTALSRSG